MELNKKKSGIVPFANRYAREVPFLSKEIERVENKNGVEEQEMKWVVFRKEYDGVPICLQYKYLGTLLDFKLSMETQMKHIKRKCGWIYIRLYPYLAQASAEGRRDIWQIMIAPLFESLSALVNEEYSGAALEKVFRLWRGTFKQIMMLPKNADSIVVGEMLGSDFTEIVRNSRDSALQKWEMRKNRGGKEIRGLKCTRYNPLLGIGSVWCDIIRSQSRICHKCKREGEIKITSAEHLEEKHGIDTLSYRVIWDDIRNYYVRELEEFKKLKGRKKLKRKEFKERWENNLIIFKNDLDKKVGAIV